MKDKATSLDIAHLAGVSQSTVSRALSNSPLVNRETRLKIQQLAEQYNYKVDKNASNLRKQRSGTLAVLIFEDPTIDDSQINPFFISMLAHLTRYSSELKYDLLVSFQNLAGDWHAEYNDTHKADGLILLGYGDYLAYQDKLQSLMANNTPFVRWGAPDPNYPGVSIGSDNFAGGQLIADFIKTKAYRKAIFIGTVDSGAPEFCSRYLGVIEGLKNFDCEITQYNADSTTVAASGIIDQLLTEDALPDVVICASDIIAIGAFQTLSKAGYKVPQDVAVIGYDNTPMCSYLTPTLTTVNQDTHLASKYLVDTLLKNIDGQAVTDHLIVPTFIEREST